MSKLIEFSTPLFLLLSTPLPWYWVEEIRHQYTLLQKSFFSSVKKKHLTFRFLKKDFIFEFLLHSIRHSKTNIKESWYGMYQAVIEILPASRLEPLSPGMGTYNTATRPA